MATPVYARYRAAFARAVADALSQPLEEIEPQIKPAEAAHGDLSFATFTLAKTQRKAPPAIASSLAQTVRVEGMEIAAAGPYLNARFHQAPFGAEVIAAARGEGARYGGSEAGRGKKVVAFDMKKAPPDDQTLLAHLLGPTGNLKAPTLRLGDTLLVGFSEEAYRQVLGV